MTRAAGKHTTPRSPVIATDEPTQAAHGQGVSDRMSSDPSPIPGGRVHLVNPPVERQRTPVPDSRAEIKDLNAHGVPAGTATAHERAEMMRGAPDTRIPAPRYEHPITDENPVPVRIVQDRDAYTLRTSSHRNFQLTASGGVPVRVAGQDHNRVRILLLNESTSSNARFAQRESDLVNGGGSLLPWPANTYLTLETQDELYAVSADSGTPRISVIQEFEQPW